MQIAILLRLAKEFRQAVADRNFSKAVSLAGQIAVHVALMFAGFNGKITADKRAKLVAEIGALRNPNALRVIGVCNAAAPEGVGASLGGDFLAKFTDLVIRLLESILNWKPPTTTGEVAKAA